MKERLKILVTGATGFVGRAMCSNLEDLGHSVIRTSRVKTLDHTKLCYFVTGDLSEPTDWKNALTGTEIVIHLAAKAHILKDSPENSLEDFTTINTTASIALAEQAVAAGVKRFIFISTIGVNGAETFGTPFKNSDCAKPHSPYAKSKYDAEMALKKIFSATDSELVIIRPPMIYGIGAPGNFSLISKFIRSNIPLPLRGISNRRSFIALENFISLVVHCISHPSAPKKTLLVSDCCDLSTTEFVHIVGKLMGKEPKLFTCPQNTLKFFLHGLGKKMAYKSLFGDLEINSEETCRVLNWSPPFNPFEFLNLKHDNQLKLTQGN